MIRAVSRNASTFGELLRRRAELDPDGLAYVFLHDSGVEERVTYAELDARACAIAARLACEAPEPGARVLILHQQNLDYVASFFGCLYAGSIAVPLFPPKSARMLPRFESILSDARPAIALIDGAHVNRTREMLARSAHAAELRLIASNEFDEYGDEHGLKISRDAESLAFLQYTSGSTSEPRGVMLTHANLMHNTGAMNRTIRAAPGDVYLSWLPLFHDMGIIGMMLAPLHAGCTGVLMSPARFLSRPLSWIAAISRWRAVVSGGPNFAFDLCARAAEKEDVSHLDLRSWRVAFCGSEPIRAEVLDRFARAFAPAGFSRRSLFPCYGLAEASLMVSGGPVDAEPIVVGFDRDALAGGVARECDGDHRVSLVGCGAAAEQEIVIADPKTRARMADGEIGEVWVNGLNVARGYWGKPEKSESTFGARLGDGTGPFLRTGDLGFLRCGQLFIAGRIKDMLIFRGRNYYPQDIEQTAESSHASLRPGGSAAFAIDTNGEERLALVLELNFREKPDFDEVIGDICSGIAREHELNVYSVALIRAGTIPKTSSGKIRRAETRKFFLEGKLETVATRTFGRADEFVIAHDEFLDAAETIRCWICTFAGVETFDPTRDLLSLGFDSLMRVRLRHAIERRFGVEVFIDSESTLRSIVAEVECRGCSSEQRAQCDVHERPDQFEPTMNQKALWFHQELGPRSSAYNVAHATRLRGALDAAALQRALDRLVRRHASLRMRFVTEDGQRFTEIQSNARVLIEDQNARAWDKRKLEREIAARAQQAFDLSTAPLLRVSLFTSSESAALLIVAHHLALDGWSLDLFLRELNELYQDETGSGACALESAADYRDFCAWEKDYFASNQAERDRAYWLEALPGELPKLELPKEASSTRAKHKGGTHFFEIAPELTEKLKRLALDERGTFYVLMLAAYNALLFRHTNQNDLIVGSPAAARGSASFNRVLGHCVNLLPIRSRPRGEMSFREFLSQVRDAATAALEHQQYPFPLMIEALRPERTNSKAPLIQAVLAYQSPLPNEFGSLRAEPMLIEQTDPRFELELHLIECDGAIAGGFHYSTELFDADSCERFAERFLKLLESIAADPKAALGELEILTTRDRRLIEAANATLDTAIEVKNLHRLFQSRACSDPDSVAVIDSRVTLSYAELDRVADRIAGHLIQRGMKPAQLAAVLISKSWMQAAAVLAIHKTGGAYVPLSPDWPKVRIIEILASTDARFVLTTSDLAPLLPSNVHPLFIDTAKDGDSEIGIKPDDADDLAYVIFTSGSTGSPKGVMISHRAAANTILDINRRFGVGPDDRVLALASLTFDLSVYDIFGALAAGAAIIFPEQNELAEPALLLRRLREHRVTIWNSVPAQMEMLVAHLEATGGAMPDSLRLILLSGDWIPVNLPDRLRRLNCAARIVSLGGATEAAIWSIAHPIERVDPNWKSVPYGRPLANQRFYVLNQQLETCPPLVAGELYIGGEGLALGYWRDEDRTGRAFIKHPRTGERLYRTGDRGRWMRDGTIEFLGRADHQIKIRGYRVEPGDIESHLARHESIRECAVVPVGSNAAELRLAAYVAFHPNMSASQTEIRDRLASHLPAYMVPAAIVSVEALPRTVNGKIDRAALSARGLLVRSEQRKFRAPATDLERNLQSTWQELLKTDSIGIDDDFFALGGTSLLAVQLADRIASSIGRGLPVSAILDRPTIAQLAARLESRGHDRAILLARGNGEHPLFLVHPAGGDVAVYRELAPLLHNFDSIWGITSRALEGESEHDSIESMARDYAQIIQTLQPAGPIAIAGWSMGGVIAFAAAAELERTGRAIRSVNIIDGYLSSSASTPGEGERALWELLPGLGPEVASRVLSNSDWRDKISVELCECAPHERASRFLKLCREFGLTNGVVSPEALARQAAIHRRHHDLLLAYSPRAVLVAPIHFVAADENVSLGDPQCWRDKTSGEFSIATAPGNHFTVMTAPNVTSLAAALASITKAFPASSNSIAPRPINESGLLPARL